MVGVSNDISAWSFVDQNKQVKQVEQIWAMLTITMFLG